MTANSNSTPSPNGSMSPFEDESVFSESEVARSVRSMEYWVNGREARSPFLQAFVEPMERMFPEPESEGCSCSSRTERLVDEIGEDSDPESESNDESDESSTGIDTDEYFTDTEASDPSEFDDEDTEALVEEAEEVEDFVPFPDGEEVYEAYNNESQPNSDFESSEVPWNDLERIPADCEDELEVLFTGESGIRPDDVRIDVRAKFALPKMLKRPEMQADAERLISGVNNGELAAIHGNDIGASVKFAKTHNRNRFQLIPKGEDGSLALDANDPINAPPRVFFRGDDPDISKDRERFYGALQKASQTFKLWRERQISLCNSNSAEPIPNLIPEGYCRSSGTESLGDTDLVLTVTADKKPLPGAFARVIGPLPLQTATSQVAPSGVAIFSGLAPGVYQIIAGKEGFLERSKMVRHPDESSAFDRTFENQQKTRSGKKKSKYNIQTIPVGTSLIIKITGVREEYLKDFETEIVNHRGGVSGLNDSRDRKEQVIRGLTDSSGKKTYDGLPSSPIPDEYFSIKVNKNNFGCNGSEGWCEKRLNNLRQRDHIVFMMEDLRLVFRNRYELDKRTNEMRDYINNLDQTKFINFVIGRDGGAIREDISVEASNHMKALQAWIQANPRIKEKLSDSFFQMRSFEDQKKIYMSKFDFTRKSPFDYVSKYIFDVKRRDHNRWKSIREWMHIQWNPSDQDDRRVWMSLSPEERGKEIMIASSAPGISRHHWGSDIDIYSTELSEWKKDPLKKVSGLLHNDGFAARYGFVRTYNMAAEVGNRYMDEPWHWSYYPASKPILERLLKDINPVEAELYKEWDKNPAFRWLKQDRNWLKYVRNINEGPMFKPAG